MGVGGIWDPVPPFAPRGAGAGVQCPVVCLVTPVSGPRFRRRFGGKELPGVRGRAGGLRGILVPKSYVFFLVDTRAFVLLSREKEGTGCHVVAVPG